MPKQRVGSPVEAAFFAAGTYFRVEAALTGDDPHRSVRDPLVIRFLKYDSVPDKPLHLFHDFRFRESPNLQKSPKLFPINKSRVRTAT